MGSKARRCTFPARVSAAPHAPSELMASSEHQLLAQLRCFQTPLGMETKAAQAQSSESPALPRRINGFMLKT